MTNSGKVHSHITAASLWAMSAIGLAVGSGHELLGILLAVVFYCIMAITEWPLLARPALQIPQRQTGIAGLDYW